MQNARVDDLYRRPASVTVARLLGGHCELVGTSVEGGYECALGVAPAPSPSPRRAGRCPGAPGGAVPRRQARPTPDRLRSRRGFTRAGTRRVAKVDLGPTAAGGTTASVLVELALGVPAPVGRRVGVRVTGTLTHVPPASGVVEARRHVDRAPGSGVDGAMLASLELRSGDETHSSRTASLPPDPPSAALAGRVATPPQPSGHGVRGVGGSALVEHMGGAPRPRGTPAPRSRRWRLDVEDGGFSASTPLDLATRPGHSTWPLDLATRPGHSTWPLDLATRLGRGRSSQGRPAGHSSGTKPESSSHGRNGECSMTQVCTARSQPRATPTPTSTKTTPRPRRRALCASTAQPSRRIRR